MQADNVKNLAFFVASKVHEPSSDIRRNRNALRHLRKALYNWDKLFKRGNL